MKTTIDVQTFKNQFTDTLQHDTLGTYFKVYVNNYHQLQLFNHYISQAIGFMAQVLEDHKQHEEIGYSITYLTKLLQATSLKAESEGLDKLLNKQ